MFGLGLPEILIILLIIVFIFGAKRLPDIGEGLGKTVREIRKIREEKKAGKEGKEKTKKEEEKKVQKGNLMSELKKEVEWIPGVKEVRTIKETAEKVKNLTKLLK
ncbi:MAG: twin-arginine translocase TatA/TatE family subunit [Desulfobacterales bacterium]|nr:twin-arginine translocase TatA/TatE family subunit [Desulfobacterales bacterium]